MLNNSRLMSGYYPVSLRSFCGQLMVILLSDGSYLLNNLMLIVRYYPVILRSFDGHLLVILF